MAGFITISVNVTTNPAQESNAVTDMKTIGVFVKNLLLSRGHTINTAYGRFDQYGTATTNGSVMTGVDYNIIPTETRIDFTTGTNAATNSTMPNAVVIPPASGAQSTFTANP